MFWFNRDQEVLRGDMHLSAGGECALGLDLPAGATPREQYKLFQSLYVTLFARLLYDAGQGEVSEYLLRSNRALFNDLLQKEPVADFRPGECLEAYRGLKLVDVPACSGEKHALILKRKKDNRVFCEVKSSSGEGNLMYRYGPWALVMYGEQKFGSRVYKDLSDALYRMNRFYQDMPYWEREGLMVVPLLTLGIMRK